MKKLCSLLFVCLSSATLFAQKNMVKVNLPALALKNISLQYERKVAKKVAVAATFRYMPTGNIPLKSTFKNFADDPDTERQLDNLRVGNFAVMPEARFYFSKKGAFHGFYLGLYANIARYNADIPFEFDDAGVTKTIPMSGHLTGITGGLLFRWAHCFLAC